MLARLCVWQVTYASPPAASVLALSKPTCIRETIFRVYADGAYKQNLRRVYAKKCTRVYAKWFGVYTQSAGRIYAKSAGAYTQDRDFRVYANQHCAYTQTSMCAYTQTSIARIRKPDPVFNVRLRMPVIRTKLGARPHAHVRVPRYWFLRTCMYQSACVWLLKIGC
jgi:hypothetical protein